MRLPASKHSLKIHLINYLLLLQTDESLSIDSPQHSEDFASTDLNFDESPKSAVALPSGTAFVSLAGNEPETTRNSGNKPEISGNSSSVAIVNHGLIVSAKTDTVEHVVIPEKKSGCCLIL